MGNRSPKSKCLLCDSTYMARGLSRHLASCIPKHASDPKSRSAQVFLHLCVQDLYAHEYFLHLLVRKTTTLADLDAFLLDIWLECCGHLSAFTWDRWGDEIPMSHRIGDITRPGDALHYQYDFGSTTELFIRVVGRHKLAPGKRKKILLLARNEQPRILCDQCGRHPAVAICIECQCWLCEKCLRTHEHDPEMRLPVVNSPRAGVCAYTG